MSRTTDWPKSQMLDEVLGNRTVDGIEESVRVGLDDFSLAIAASGVLAALRGIVKLGRAALFADLNHPADTPAIVGGDTIPGRNGLYVKVGAVGTGSWLQVTKFIPGTQVARARNTGAGTANAVQAVAGFGFSRSAFETLLWVDFAATNTGAMELSVDEDTRPLVLNSGAPVPPGYVKEGLIALVAIDTSGNWRLVTYGDAEAVQAAVEVLYAQVIALRDIVLGAATLVTDPQYSTKALAEGVRFTAFPAEIRTAFLDASQEPGSGALWGAPVDVEPSHAAKLEATLDDEITKKWYVLLSRSIKPRQISSNDDIAISTALRSDVNEGRAIDLGYSHFTLTQKISRTLAANLIIRGDDARIEFDPAAHVDRMIAINVGGTRRKIDIEGFDISGGAKANVGIEIRNQVASMADANTAEVRVRAMFQDARRIAAAGNGGAGLDVVGGFSRVHFDHVRSKNTILPAGQGSSGSQGMAGLRCRATPDGISVPLLFIQENCEVEANYSEDPDYNWDQDGISYTVGNRSQLDTVAQSVGGLIKNSAGRGIKLQCAYATVTGAHFIRTLPLLNSPKDPEVDLQLTGGTIDKCTAYYEGGGRPNRFAMLSGREVGFPPAEARLTNTTIRMGAGTTTIGDFMTAWADKARLGDVHVGGNKIHGTVRSMVDYRVNGPVNNLYYESNWAQEYSADTDGHRAAIRLIASAPDNAPYQARITTKDIYYDGSETVHVLKDAITGSVATATHSAIGEHRGFVNNLGAAVPSGLRSVLSNTIQTVGANDPRGLDRRRIVTVPNEMEVEVPIYLQNGPWLFVMMNAASRSYGGIVRADNTSTASYNLGSNTQVGNNADPGAGVLRMWRSGNNVMKLWQSTGLTRRVLIFELNVS